MVGHVLSVSARAGANATWETEECTRLPTVFFANRHHCLSRWKEKI
jgi:hypothetical protein